MIPPDSYKRRVFQLLQPPAGKWNSIEYHEAGHVVAAEFYGIKPYRAECDRNRGDGKMLLTPLSDERKNTTAENGALGAFGIVGLSDSSNSFDEIAYRTAVIFMAGVQAEFIQAGVNQAAGVLHLNDQDTRQASYVLHTLFKTDIGLAWAQMQARHILEQNWQRVEEIAGELKLKGYWEYSGTSKPKKKPKTSKAVEAARFEARQARMVPAILRKLEEAPGVPAQQVLNADELDEARLMSWASVQFINDFIEEKVKTGEADFRLPSRFKWRTTWLDLLTSNLDRVFIASKSGAPLIASGFGAIL